MNPTTQTVKGWIREPHPSHRLGEWEIVAGGSRRRVCGCGAFETVHPEYGHGVSDDLLQECPESIDSEGAERS